MDEKETKEQEKDQSSEMESGAPQPAAAGQDASDDILSAAGLGGIVEVKEAAKTTDDSSAEAGKDALEPKATPARIDMEAMEGLEGILTSNAPQDDLSIEIDVSPEETLRKRKSLMTFLIMIAVIGIIIGVGIFLLSKYTDFFKGNWSAKKSAKAQAVYEKKLAEQEKNKPVYGRAEFFIEPVPVNIYFNGKLDPNSPTKHAVVLNWKIKKLLTVKLEPVKKPTDKLPMWYEKNLTFTENDWKVVEGIRIIRQMVDIIPTPDNKDYVDPKEAAKLKKKLEREKKRKKRRR